MAKDKVASKREESQATAWAIPSESKLSEDKAQYIVALIAEFAAHFGLTTRQAVEYLSRYKALELYDRQYGYLHTQLFASNVRDLSAYCRRMGGTL